MPITVADNHIACTVCIKTIQITVNNDNKKGLKSMFILIRVANFCFSFNLDLWICYILYGPLYSVCFLYRKWSYPTECIMTLSHKSVNVFLLICFRMANIYSSHAPESKLHWSQQLCVSFLVVKSHGNMAMNSFFSSWLICGKQHTGLVFCPIASHLWLTVKVPIQLPLFETNH